MVFFFIRTIERYETRRFTDRILAANVVNVLVVNVSFSGRGNRLRFWEFGRHGSATPAAGR